GIHGLSVSRSPGPAGKGPLSRGTPETAAADWEKRSSNKAKAVRACTSRTRLLGAAPTPLSCCPWADGSESGSEPSAGRTVRSKENDSAPDIRRCWDSCAAHRG